MIKLVLSMILISVFSQTFQKYEVHFRPNPNKNTRIVIDRTLKKCVYSSEELDEGERLWSEIYMIDKDPELVCNSIRNETTTSICLCTHKDITEVLEKVDFLKHLEGMVSEDLGVKDCPSSCQKRGKGKKCHEYFLTNGGFENMQYYILEEDKSPVCMMVAGQPIEFDYFSQSYNSSSFEYPFNPNVCDYE